MTELTYLDPPANGVKDISALSGLKNPTGLNLDFDHVTEEQANALQAQLPGCKLQRQGNEAAAKKAFALMLAACDLQNTRSRPDAACARS